MSVFHRTGSLRPRRHAFDLTHSVMTTADMGKIIPVMCEEMSPGDTFQIGHQTVVRYQPLVAPIMHEVELFVHSFFVPYRILMPIAQHGVTTPIEGPAPSPLASAVGDAGTVMTGGALSTYNNSPDNVVSAWNIFISGGTDGSGTIGARISTPPTADGFPAAIPPNISSSVIMLPRWNPNATDMTLHSLWDYFGFPVVMTNTPPFNSPRLPLSFPKRAYNLVWNEYYRDENLQSRISLDSRVVMRRNWTKDYFTAALPFQQRGAAPAFPISGETNAVWDTTVNPALGGAVLSTPFGGGVPVPFTLSIDPAASGGSVAGTGGIAFSGVGTPGSVSELYANPIQLNRNTVSFANASTFNVSFLRLAVQIQKWMERNARAGVRASDFIKSHFGVSPRDDRLMRPEYIGGSRMPITVSEVLNTGGTNPAAPPIGDPQGQMAGHGLCAESGYIGTYKAYEYGCIITLLSVMPKKVYEDGIERMWLRQTRYDFYFPEFAHLSEQGIMNGEVFYDGSPNDMNVWGFQGRYDELRWRRSRVTGEFRVKVPSGFQSLSYWHLAESYASLPPLNNRFSICEPSDRIFAVSGVPGLMIHHVNNIKAIRPMPEMSEPGLMDHF